MKLQVRHPDPVEPPRATCLNKGRPVVLEERQLRGRRQHLPVRLTVHRCTLGRAGRRAHADALGQGSAASSSGRRTTTCRSQIDLPTQHRTTRSRRPGSPRRGTGSRRRLVETLGPRLYDAALSDSRSRASSNSTFESCWTRRSQPSPHRRSSSSFVRSVTACLGLVRSSRSPATRRHRDHGDALGLHLRRARRPRSTGPAPSSTTTLGSARSSTRSWPGSAAGSTRRRRTWTRACPTARA